MGKRKRNHEAHAGQEKNQGKENNGMADKPKEKKSCERGVKKALSWIPAQEIVVLEELAKLPKAKADNSNSKHLGNSSVNWEQLAIAVGARLDLSLSRTQIYEKVRRLKERYIRTQENISAKKFSSFKNEDDSKIYALSGKVWGFCGALLNQRDEQEHDLPSSNLKKGQNVRKKAQADGSLSAEVEKTQEEHAPFLHSKALDGQASSDTDGVSYEQASNEAGNSFHEQEDCNDTDNSHEQTKANQRVAPQLRHEGSDAGCASHDQASDDAGNPSREQDYDGASNGSHEQTKQNKKAGPKLKNEGIERIIKKGDEIFYSEHQALLSNIQETCMTAIQDMQTKFLTLLRNTVRRGQCPCVGVSASMPSAGLVLQDSVALNRMLDKCQSQTEANNSVASQSLSQQWLQQHLKELQLTSLKLELMLDGCKKEKEKLEKQVLKS